MESNSKKLDRIDLFLISINCKDVSEAVKKLGITNFRIKRREFYSENPKIKSTYTKVKPLNPKKPVNVKDETVNKYKKIIKDLIMLTREKKHFSVKFFFQQNNASPLFMKSLIDEGFFYYAPFNGYKKVLHFNEEKSNEINNKNVRNLIFIKNQIHNKNYRK